MQGSAIPQRLQLSMRHGPYQDTQGPHAVDATCPNHDVAPQHATLLWSRGQTVPVLTGQGPPALRKLLNAQRQAGLLLQQNRKSRKRSRTAQQPAEISQQLHRRHADLFSGSLRLQTNGIEQGARQRIGTTGRKPLLIALTLPASVPQRIEAMMKK